MAKQQMSKDDQDKGITAISVQGFKSLANESRIAIRPLTILAGANSSGKSSIMQPLLLMKQTLEASYDPGPLLLNGPNVNFTSFDQLISRLQKNSDCQEFSVEINHATYPTLKIMFFLNENQTLEIREMIIGEDEHSLHLRSNHSSDDLEKVISKFRQKKIELSKGSKFKIVRSRCFLNVAYETLNDEAKVKFSPVLQIYESGIFSFFVFREELHNMIHVPGLRGNPERVYPRTATGPDFPGTFEHYVATIIADWQEKKDGRLKRLEAMLTALGLTWKISAKPVNDTQIELQVGRLLRIKARSETIS